MANELRFDGRVAIVTGAGGGLGRSHALLLGSRGCKVVVNDLGGGMHGGGKSSAAADRVVEEIKAAGGEAVANYDSVEDGAQIVQTALDTWGRLDIVINNAGILRDTSFHKMSQEDWDLIYRVHVLGGFRVTQAAWSHLRDAGYGRIVFTASAAGIYGNFGQANYSMAKMGLHGLANTLAIEGQKKGIHVNTIAPIAGSRLTETVMPKDLLDALKPEYVSPLVAWLCSEECEETGGLFEVGGGFHGKLRWQRAQGKTFKLGRAITPEQVKAAWPEIAGFEKVSYPKDITESMGPILGNLGSKSRGSNEFIDVDEALAADVPARTSSYDERDLALYALGVGAAEDPLDPKELPFVFERSSDGFLALPTFAVVPALKVMFDMAQEGKAVPGLRYGFDRVLHGEQYTEVKRPLPRSGKLTHKMRIKDIFDKGRHAIVVTAVTTTDENGEELAYNEISTFVRGAGGFGGERGPQAEINVPPERAPDAVVEEKTHPNQALLYRLSGDWNPLHADPGFAKAFGFSKPILHGLCTYGFSGRHVVKAMLDNDPRKFKSIKVRFADTVFPGETLITEMWRESPSRVIFRTKVKERDKVVISNAAVELYTEVPAAKGKPAATGAGAAAAGAAAANVPTSADILTAVDLFLQRNPDIAQKTQTVFQWKLTAPDAAWVLDAKNGAGSCKPGTADRPDCTLELSEADFIAMSTGQADPQKLYFGGKLKISGNVMASQKMGFLKKVDPALVVEAMKQRTGGAAAPAAAQAQAASSARSGGASSGGASSSGTSGGGAQAEKLFAALAERLQKNPNLWSEVKAVLQFQVKDRAWVVDLASAPGAVREGKEPKAQAVLTLDEETLLALARGGDAHDLFQRGQLRVDGDVRLAQKLAFLKSLA